MTAVAPADGAMTLVNRVLDRAAGSRPIPGNRVTLLFDGPQIFPAMLARIAAAREWVHFDNYIIRDDRIGRRFAEAFIERARSGVRVRVLTDWLGSFGTGGGYWRALRQAGVEVRIFGPPTFLRPLQNLSRNHRKLMVVDGRSAVTGGHCIGDEWQGDPERGRPPWRDTAVAIEGPAASSLDHAFAMVWRRIGPDLPEGELLSDVPACGEAEVRVISTEPGTIRGSRTAELLLAGASERIWLTDAYLVAPRGIYRSLLDAAREGVDVRLLVPGTSDLPHVRNLTRTGYRDLLHAGVRIFEWRGPMLHAKSIVVDGRWTRVGSTNMNLSSLIANYELDVLIDDPDLAADMEAQFRRDLDRSVEVKLLPARFFRNALGFTAETTDTTQPPARGLRETRRRTVVTLRAVLGGSQRVLVIQQGLALTILAVLLLLFPAPMGILLGVLTLYLALTAAGETYWRRRGGEAERRKV